MNYNKKSKAELIKLLKFIDSAVLIGLEYCNDEKKIPSKRLGYALGTLRVLNEHFNETKNE